MGSIDALLSNNASYARGFSRGDLPMPPADRPLVAMLRDML